MEGIRLALGYVVVDAFIVIVYRHTQHFLGSLLANNMLVEVLIYLKFEKEKDIGCATGPKYNKNIFNTG